MGDLEHLAEMHVDAHVIDHESPGAATNLYAEYKSACLVASRLLRPWPEWVGVKELDHRIKTVELVRAQPTSSHQKKTTKLIDGLRKLPVELLRLCKGPKKKSLVVFLHDAGFGSPCNALEVMEELGYDVETDHAGSLRALRSLKDDFNAGARRTPYWIDDENGLVITLHKKDLQKQVRNSPANHREK